jgi:hypothetical protein
MDSQNLRTLEKKRNGRPMGLTVLAAFAAMCLAGLLAI